MYNASPDSAGFPYVHPPFFCPCGVQSTVPCEGRLRDFHIDTLLPDEHVCCIAVCSNASPTDALKMKRYKCLWILRGRGVCTHLSQCSHNHNYHLPVIFPFWHVPKQHHSRTISIAKYCRNTRLQNNKLLLESPAPLCTWYMVTLG